MLSPGLRRGSISPRKALRRFSASVRMVRLSAAVRSCLGLAGSWRRMAAPASSGARMADRAALSAPRSMEVRMRANAPFSCSGSFCISRAMRAMAISFFTGSRGRAAAMRSMRARWGSPCISPDARRAASSLSAGMISRTAGMAWRMRSLDWRRVARIWSDTCGRRRSGMAERSGSVLGSVPPRMDSNSPLAISRIFSVEESSSSKRVLMAVKTAASEVSLSRPRCCLA